MTDLPAVTRSASRGRPAWQPVLELVLIAAACGLVVALARDVVVACVEERIGWVLPAGLLVGLGAADFASGALHWFCDRFFAADTPLVGRTLIAPFREHHDDPQAIVRHSMLELHGNSCLPVIAALLLARLVPLSLFLESSLLFFVSASLATNQFHRWAHDAEAGPAVRWMQQRGVILSPQAHARHHCGDFDRTYCMTTGWLNPLLDRAGLFPRLERAIRSWNPQR